MKRLWIAGILLVLLISFCSLGIFQILRHEDKLIGIITQAIEAAENDDFVHAYELAAQSEQEWIKSEKALALFTNHKCLSDVGLAVSKLPPLIMHGSKAQFISECTYSIVQIKHLASDEIPSLNNVF